ncbi:MAG: hypothetical protein ACO1N1_05035 [Dyadobacter fermentans]
MRGHYLLKWLFLTVLSVSVLHFREAVPVDRYRVEQVSDRQHYGSREVFSFKHSTPSDNRKAQFAHFRNTQLLIFKCLSTSLSIAAGSDPAFSFRLTLSRFHIQNQHFRSRTPACDDPFILHS